MYLYFIGLMIIGLMIVGLMIIGFKCDFYVEIQKVMKWLQIFFVLSFLIKKGEVNFYLILVLVLQIGYIFCKKN